MDVRCYCSCQMMVRLLFFLLILFRILESVPTSDGLEVWKFGILATPFDSSVPLKSVDGQVSSFPLSSKIHRMLWSLWRCVIGLRPHSSAVQFKCIGTKLQRDSVGSKE